MLSLFEGGDNQVAPAADLRVVTLLDRGVREARSLDGDPAIQAELNHTLGTIYQGLGKLTRPTAPAVGARRAAAGVRRRAPRYCQQPRRAWPAAQDQARLEEAEQLVREGLDGLRRALPPHHPAVARALVALGRVLQERGKLDEAIPPLDEAVRLFSASPSEEADSPRRSPRWPTCTSTPAVSMSRSDEQAGPRDGSPHPRRRHPHVADDLLNLGPIESSRGHHPEAARYIAKRWHSRGLVRRGSPGNRLGDGDPRPVPLTAGGVRGGLRSCAGPANAGAGLWQGASARRVRANELGLVAFKRKDHEAETRFAARSRSTTPSTAAGRLAWGLQRAISPASISPARTIRSRQKLFRETLALYATLLSPEHLNIGIAEAKLGRALLRQRRFQQAEVHLVTAQDIFTRQPKSSLVWLRTAREDLIAVYDALKQPERAQTIRRALEREQTQ